MDTHLNPYKLFRFRDYSKARVAVLPVPYEGTVCYGKGAARGPQAIVDALQYLEGYDEELDAVFTDIGIALLPPLATSSDSVGVGETLYRRTKMVLDENRFPVIIGGEHSFIWGSVKACAEKYPDLWVLYLDAHGDFRDHYEGNKYSHACAFRRMMDIIGFRFVHVGARSISVEESELIQKHNLRKKFYFAKDIVPISDEQWMDDAVSQLGPNVYISIDVDCLDPSIMPATGAPEPGGLQWYPLLHLLRKVCQQRNVVGFDIVELAPQDDAKGPDFLVSKLLYKIIGYLFFDKSL